MNLIERYVTEVGKRLPRKIRTDIETELHSTLEDMLEDRSREAGQPADNAMVQALLKDYGSPEQVARSYQPAGYLIGPRLFPTFTLVLKIVLSVVGAVVLVGFGINVTSTGFSGPGFLSALWNLFLQLLGGAITIFGNVTLVFAILERTLPASEFDPGEGEEWDPAALAKEPDPDQVSPAGLIFEMIFIAGFLAVFNLYPDLVGLHFVVNGEWVSIPVLSEAFFRVLPWINLVALLEIGLDLYLLRQQVWQPATRAIKIILEGLGIAIAVVLLRGPSLIAIQAESFAGSPISVETGETLIRIFTPMVPIILIIIIVMSGIEIAQMAFRFFKVNYKTRMEFKS